MVAVITDWAVEIRSPIYFDRKTDAKAAKKYEYESEYAKSA